MLRYGNWKTHTVSINKHGECYIDGERRIIEADDGVWLHESHSVHWLVTVGSSAHDDVEVRSFVTPEQCAQIPAAQAYLRSLGK